MSRTIICPYCQLPQVLEEAPREASDEVYCEFLAKVLGRQSGPSKL